MVAQNWHIFVLLVSSNFFTARIRRKFVIILPLKIPAHFQCVSLHYLAKFQCFKATIENKSSLATYFNKITTGNNVFIVAIIV